VHIPFRNTLTNLSPNPYMIRVFSTAKNTKYRPELTYIIIITIIIMLLTNTGIAQPSIITQSFVSSVFNHITFLSQPTHNGSSLSHSPIKNPLSLLFPYLFPWAIIRWYGLSLLRKQGKASYSLYYLERWIIVFWWMMLIIRRIVEKCGSKNYLIFLLAED